MELNLVVMKKLFLAPFIAFLFLVSCNSNAQNENADTVEIKSSEVSYLVLGPKEFSQKLELEANPQLIDVRTLAEFNLGSIEGAKNFDILNGTLQSKLSSLDKTKNVYVFCAKGGRSNKASKMLQDAGFTSVIDLKGGYTAWSESNY